MNHRTLPLARRLHRWYLCQRRPFPIRSRAFFVSMAASCEKITFGKDNLPGYVVGEVKDPAVVVIQVRIHLALACRLANQLPSDPRLVSHTPRVSAHILSKPKKILTRILCMAIYFFFKSNSFEFFCRSVHARRNGGAAPISSKPMRPRSQTVGIVA
jgi:hypothetical protein